MIHETSFCGFKFFDLPIKGEEAKNLKPTREDFMFNHQKLKCYEYALDVARKVPTLIGKWSSGYAYLEDQLKRAASSVVLNIAEGNYRYSTKERTRFFTIARASAGEVSSIFDIAHAYCLVRDEDYRILQNTLLSIIKMLSHLR
jgi:four helix bundle protein